MHCIENARASRCDSGIGLVIEVPTTGVPYGEVPGGLHESLGHEARLSVELFSARTATAASARAIEKPAAIFNGPASEPAQVLRLAGPERR